MSYVVSAPTNAHAKEIIGFPNGLLTRAFTLEFPPNLNISPILTLQSVCLSLRPFECPDSGVSKLNSSLAWGHRWNKFHLQFGMLLEIVDMHQLYPRK